MGKSSCCDEVGIKKGPWTPEEDTVLVSYIQEHGPRNWRSVPTNTGLMRCSKSCRLRWTNYLRPGIKHGNFTPQEERMIIHLQALLGNRWAAIASYLPQRTDNDIKNYWNTNLQKRIKKHTKAIDRFLISTDSAASCGFEFASRTYYSDTSIPAISTLNPTLPRFFHTSSTYASSTENISRLLKCWMMPTADSNAAATTTGTGTTTTSTLLKPVQQENNTFSNALSPQAQIHSMLSFDNNLGVSGWDNSSADITVQGISDEDKQRSENSQAPLSLFDTWLLDEAAGRMEGLMEQWQQQQ